MHRHVKHLVNTCQIEFLIHDLELFPFQGICSLSVITESISQQSLRYVKKTRKESWSCCELTQQLPFYHLHSSSTKTPQNLRWKKKKKATIFLCSAILTIPTFVFTLYPGGDGERRKRDKERRWEGETDGVGKAASNRKGKNRLRWRAKVKRGGRLE